MDELGVRRIRFRAFVALCAMMARLPSGVSFVLPRDLGEV
jgi:hypothetical protein